MKPQRILRYAWSSSQWSGKGVEQVGKRTEFARQGCSRVKRITWSGLMTVVVCISLGEQRPLTTHVLCHPVDGCSAPAPSLRQGCGCGLKNLRPLLGHSLISSFTSPFTVAAFLQNRFQLWRNYLIRRFCGFLGCDTMRCKHCHSSAKCRARLLGLQYIYIYIHTPVFLNKTLFSNTVHR